MSDWTPEEITLLKKAAKVYRHPSTVTVSTSVLTIMTATTTTTEIPLRRLREK
jgi:hypothetical protein